jgi:hypothetical protein
MKLAVNYAMGRGRVTTLDESREISPRLAPSALAEWLDGFEVGLGEIERRIHERARSGLHGARTASEVFDEVFGSTVETERAPMGTGC